MAELTQEQIDALIQEINDAEAPESVTNEMVATVLNHLNKQFKAGNLSLGDLVATISTIQASINSLQAALSGVSDELQSIGGAKTDKNTHTGKLTHQQAPTVVLASMGQDLDSVGKSNPVAHVAKANEYIWDPTSGNILYYKTAENYEPLGAPQRGIVYTNAHSNRQYRWLGNAWQQVGGGGGVSSVTAFSNYVVKDSTNELPSEGDTATGYIVGTHIYAYVGENGDTADEKYQDLGDLGVDPDIYQPRLNAGDGIAIAQDGKTVSVAEGVRNGAAAGATAVQAINVNGQEQTKNNGVVNIQSVAGADGKSAYQSYLDTTTDNPKKGEAEWLASLNGNDGVSGNYDLVVVNNLEGVPEGVDPTTEMAVLGADVGEYIAMLFGGGIVDNYTSDRGDAMASARCIKMLYDNFMLLYNSLANMAFTNGKPQLSWVPTYNVNYRLTGCTAPANAALRVVSGYAFNVVITKENLHNNIATPVVLMGGVPLDTTVQGNSITTDTNYGTVTIAIAKVTGDLAIKVVMWEDGTYPIDYDGLSNCHVDENSPTSVAENGQAVIVLEPDANYEFTTGYESNIEVSMGSETLEQGNGYTVALDSNTGKVTITIAEVTGVVEVTAVATIKVFSVTFEGEGFEVSADGNTYAAPSSDTINAGQAYHIYLRKDSHAVSLTSVTVKIGGVAKTGVYDSSTGEITIAAAEVTGNITIKVVAVMKMKVLKNFAWINTGDNPGTTGLAKKGATQNGVSSSISNYVASDLIHIPYNNSANYIVAAHKITGGPAGGWAPALLIYRKSGNTFTQLDYFQTQSSSTNRSFTATSEKFKDAYEANNLYVRVTFALDTNELIDNGCGIYRASGSSGTLTEIWKPDNTGGVAQNYEIVASVDAFNTDGVNPQNIFT